MSITVTNHGTVNGPMSMRVDGPIAGVVITQEVGGRTKMIALPELELGEGDKLIVGSIENQSAILNGTRRMDRFLTSRQWFSLEPGDNVFTLTTKRGRDATDQLIVTASSAW